MAVNYRRQSLFLVSTTATYAYQNLPLPVGTLAASTTGVKITCVTAFNGSLSASFQGTYAIVSLYTSAATSTARSSYTNYGSVVGGFSAMQTSSETGSPALVLDISAFISGVGPQIFTQVGYLPWAAGSQPSALALELTGTCGTNFVYSIFVDFMVAGASQNPVPSDIVDWSCSSLSPSVSGGGSSAMSNVNIAQVNGVAVPASTLPINISQWGGNNLSTGTPVPVGITEVGGTTIGTTVPVSVSNTPSVSVSGTASVSVANTPTVTVSGTTTVSVANTPTVTIGSMPTVTLAGTSSVNLAQVGGNSVSTAVPITTGSNNLPVNLTQWAGAAISSGNPLPTTGGGGGSGGNVNLTQIGGVAVSPANPLFVRAL